MRRNIIMKKHQVTIRSSAAEYLTYVASVGEETHNVEVRYEEENIWLTQKMLGVLFNVEAHTINYHIKKISKFSVYHIGSMNINIYYYHSEHMYISFNIYNLLKNMC